MLARILLLSARSDFRARIRALAEGPDAVVGELTDTSWATELPRRDCDLVIADGEFVTADIKAAVDAARAAPGSPELVVIAKDETAVERASLLAAGSLAVLPENVADDVLGEALRTLIDRRIAASLLERGVSDTEPEGSFGDYVTSGNGEAANRFLRLARKLSQSDSTALILGETGVGKERLARAIHAEGPRADGPFIVVNCGAIPESLLESELFGHEKGAFTGAVRAHRGHFELAHRGTIFLDEIGEMPLHLQVKLLRAIQDKAIQRVGSEIRLPVDVRIMAATNRDLLVEMEEQRFRPDLYYRLSVVAIDVPPLRDRPDDIEPLVRTYFEQFRLQMPTAATGVAPAAMRALRAYRWPGNIRELVNVVERAVLLCDGTEIALEDLPAALAETVEPPAPASPPTSEGRPDDGDALDAATLAQPLAAARRRFTAKFERAYLDGMLRATGGRISETAARAGIDPRSLYAKMKQHGLRKEDYRT